MISLTRLIDPKAINNNRLDWIDYAKGIAISMVVYRHVLIGIQLAGFNISTNLELTTEFGLTFRMPLFFLLSGIFYTRSVSKRSRYGYFIHKFKTIMYPYFLWSFIQMSLQMLLIEYTNAQFTSISDYLLIFYKPRAQFWFLYALFNVSILYLLLSSILKNKYLLLILGIALFYFAPGGYWGKPLNDIMRLFVFFVIGDIISPVLLNRRNYKLFESKYLIFSLFLIALFGEWIIVILSNTNPFIILSFAIIGSASTIGISFYIASFQNKFLSIIRIIGYHSLYIFLLHPLFSAGFRIIMINAFHIYNIPVLLTLGTIFGIIGPVFFYSICNYYGFWFLFNPDKPVEFKKIQ